MGIEVDKEIVEKATQCTNGFRCLSEDNAFLCEVVVPLGSDIVEVKSKSVRSCCYGLSVGNSRYCHCPIRNEIYNLYKV